MIRPLEGDQHHVGDKGEEHVLLGERFAAAVEMFNQQQFVEAREALTAILTDYHTPEN